MATAVIMPKQGQSVESCVIGKWHKQVGDKVSVGDTLFTYETDKATFDEEAKAEGILLAVLFEEGDDVDCLKTVCVIGAEGESYEELKIDDEEPEITNGKRKVESVKSGNDESPHPAPESQITARDSNPVEDNSQFSTFNVQLSTPDLKISPRARKLAQKTGADVGRAVPTGANGRIMEADIQRAAEQGHLATRAAAHSGDNISGIIGTGIGGRIKIEDNSQLSTSHFQHPDVTGFEEVKLTNVRKYIAKAMHASLSQSAQLTHHTSFDATDVLEFRRKLKTMESSANQPPGSSRMTSDPQNRPAAATITDIIIYAVSRVLLKHKSMNAHYLGDTMALFNNAHIGIAVDTPRGLLVPTLFKADTLTLDEIACQTKELFEKCRQGGIGPDALKGASFTISNLGTMGIEMFTPIINPPQTGILGVCSIVERTKDGGKFYPAMGLSLTYDHRALDGADASRFLKDLTDYLENFTFRLNEGENYV